MEVTRSMEKQRFVVRRTAHVNGDRTLCFTISEYFSEVNTAQPVKGDVEPFEVRRRCFFVPLVTMDESLIYKYHPENKEMSKKKKHNDSSPLQKTKVQKSLGKFMLRFFRAVVESS
ncbi:hypothetical protein TNCV_2072451 [Trichonephila clavipes]|nr:hypothetical protein TNCV_2072451 [Trichonephila clavipes]